MNNLRKYRAAKGLTMQELAKLVGVSRTGLGLAENGHLSISLAQKCSKVLEVNVFELLGEDALVLPVTCNEDIIAIVHTLNKAGNRLCACDKPND